MNDVSDAIYDHRHLHLLGGWLLVVLGLLVVVVVGLLVVLAVSAVLLVGLLVVLLLVVLHWVHHVVECSILVDLVHHSLIVLGFQS